MVSALTRFASFKQIQAAATAVPTMIASNSVGGYTFAKGGKVDPLAAVCMGGAALFAARYGARIGSQVSEQYLRAGFGAFLLMLSPVFAWQSLKTDKEEAVGDGTDEETSKHGLSHEDAADSGRNSKTAENKSNEWWQKWQPEALLEELCNRPTDAAKFVLVGAVMALVQGALGVGSTPIMITYLSIYGDESIFDYKTCVGTALVAVVPSSLSSSVMHFQLGNTKWKAIPLLALGSAAGAWCGSSVALDLPTVLLQQAFAAFCAISGMGMLAKSGVLRTALSALSKQKPK